MLTKRQTIINLGLDDFFLPLIEEIKEINNNPIIVNGIKFKVNLTSVTSDNLGSNELQKITKSFKSKSCKFCKISYKKLQNQQHYRKKWRKRYHKTSVFNNLNKKIHFLVDLFHDINEGKCFLIQF